MSLRLDPKYHGVRVARVRPKAQAVQRSLKPYEYWRGFMRISEVATLFFEMDEQRRWKFPEFQAAARIDGIYCNTEKEALEALGLR